MYESKIGIERDNGELIDFNIDMEVINGLYTTLDKNKVDENIKNFNIQIEALENDVATKMSKNDDVVIITTLIDNENKFQYLVGKDMNLNELEKSNEIPLELKPLIKDAHDLSKKRTLNDLLK